MPPGTYGVFIAIPPGAIAPVAIAPGAIALAADADERREIARQSSTATTAKPAPHSHDGTPDAAAGAAAAVARAGAASGGSAVSRGVAAAELRGVVAPACARSSRRSKARNLSAEPAKASDGSSVRASRACSEARGNSSLWARISA